MCSILDPSPDWFVGVSSLELCRPDCTWIDKKTFNLYAWDAGVRNGILYEVRIPPRFKLSIHALLILITQDLDGMTVPQDIVQSLNMTWPPPREDGKESPFYDKFNNTHDVRPLARIHFKLLRGGDEKSCRSTKVMGELRGFFFIKIVR